MHCILPTGHIESGQKKVSRKLPHMGLQAILKDELAKGQLILKCPFGVFQKTNKIFPGFLL